MVRLELIVLDHQVVVFIDFNSSMVRLELSKAYAATLDAKKISIPQWCDQNVKTSLPLPPSKPISIPQWCDQNSFYISNFYGDFSISIPKWCDQNSFRKQGQGDQFQISIPQWCDQNYAVTPQMIQQSWNFNSLMVRLEFTFTF